MSTYVFMLLVVIMANETIHGLGCQLRKAGCTFTAIDPAHSAQKQSTITSIKLEGFTGVTLSSGSPAYIKLEGSTGATLSSESPAPLLWHRHKGHFTMVSQDASMILEKIASLEKALAEEKESKKKYYDGARNKRMQRYKGEIPKLEKELRKLGFHPSIQPDVDKDTKKEANSLEQIMDKVLKNYPEITTKNQIDFKKLEESLSDNYVDIFDVDNHDVIDLKKVLPNISGDNVDCISGVLTELDNVEGELNKKLEDLDKFGPDDKKKKRQDMEKLVTLWGSKLKLLKHVQQSQEFTVAREDIKNGNYLGCYIWFIKNYKRVALGIKKKNQETRVTKTIAAIAAKVAEGAEGELYRNNSDSTDSGDTESFPSASTNSD